MHNEASLLKLPFDPQAMRSNLPEQPGVYLFKDRSEQVIYIGKAKNLRKRVLTYFQVSHESWSKTGRMLQSAKSLDYILTETDQEAFILEGNLIKKYLPRYNIILRDDKRYPSLRLDPQEDFPTLMIVRKVRKDGAYYFGPFSSANAVRSTLKLIEHIFRLRKCKGRRMPKRSRPCLNYQLGYCLGPCTLPVEAHVYREQVELVKLFLEGRNRELIKALKNKMAAAAERLDYEDAARIRDRIQAVERTLEKQHVVSKKPEDLDVIGLAHQEKACQVAVLFIRRGYLSGSQSFNLKVQGDDPAEIMEAFITQYYGQSSFIPSKILISVPLTDAASLIEGLSGQASRKVSIHFPQKGEYAALVKLAIKNAEDQLKIQKSLRQEELLSKIQAALSLKKHPASIEAIDMSNISGDIAVGAIVVYQDGRPFRNGYRNYRIKSVSSVDDYGMMEEVITRRLKNGGLPDLLIIDGGKGHLMKVQSVMQTSAGADKPELVAIAKEREGQGGDKIYLPGRKNPVQFRENDPVLLFLMGIRDEVHRRAIGYHRHLRNKKIRISALDSIPGIGPEKKRALIQYFGHIKALSQANLDEIKDVPGITNDMACKIHDFLRINKDNS